MVAVRSRPVARLSGIAGFVGARRPGRAVQGELRMHRFRTVVASQAAVGLLAALAALALNVTGVVRLPVGPLGTSGEPGDFRQMAIAPQDAPDEVFTTVILGSEWPVPARLEAVRPILRSERGGAEVLGAQPCDHRTLGEDQQLVLGSVRDRPREWAGNHPVMGTQVPSAEGTGAVALVRVWNEPGAATDVAGYVIDYRIGPFAFRAVSTTNSIVLCTNDGVVPPDCDDGEQAASAVRAAAPAGHCDRRAAAVPTVEGSHKRRAARSPRTSSSRAS